MLDFRNIGCPLIFGFFMRPEGWLYKFDRIDGV